MGSSTDVRSHMRPFMGAKLQPKQGVPAGLFAGVGMMLLWSAGAQFWGVGAVTLFASIGAVIAPRVSVTHQLVAGLLLHLAISMGLGLLFAASLDRLSTRDTLVVSTFYGFTIWVVSVLIMGRWIPVQAVQMSRSGWGFLAFLFFGFLLGVFANRFGLEPVA